MNIDSQEASSQEQNPSRLYPTIFELCMTFSPAMGDQKRVLLYRELAEFCGDIAIGTRFTQMADQIESAANNHRELALKFS